MCSEFPAASACVVSCGASRVIIFPPPVLITFPGPILSTCPQETVLGSSGMVPGSLGMAEGTAGISPRAQIPRNGEFVPKFPSRPFLSVDPQEAVMGSSGMVLGSSGMISGSSGMLEGTAGISPRSYGAQFPRNGEFLPKFPSRPILGMDLQEAVLGSSGMIPGSSGMVLGSSGMIPGSSGMLEGMAGISPRSYGEQFRRFTPKSGPRRASRCSYIFTSRWIHPCRRGGGSQEPAGNRSEEKIPDPEKPETENVDAEKEEKEELEV